jgi:hypothetical protein
VSERRYQRSTVAVAFLAGFFGSFIAQRYFPPSEANAAGGADEIRTSRLVLVDASGVARGVFEVSPKGVPALRLLQPDGRPLAELSGFERAGHLSLQSADGVGRVTLNASRASPRLVVAENNRALLALDVVGGADPSLHLFDPGQKNRMTVGLDGGRPYLAMMDAGGQTRSHWLLDDDERPHFRYFTDGDRLRADFYLRGDGGPALEMSAPAGAVAASLSVDAAGRGASTFRP